MKINMKKVLLTGTALVAVSAFAQSAQAQNEFVIDTNESGTFTTAAPDERASSTFTWGSNVNAITSQEKDLQVLLDGTVEVVDGDIIGDGTGNAIVAGADAKTLTLSDASNDDGSDEITIDGNISAGAFDEFNITIEGDAGDGGDASLWTVNGNVDLGTSGVLIITPDQDDVGSDVTVSLGGNFTGSTIQIDTAGGQSNVVLQFDGTTAQAIDANISTSNSEGTIEVSNAAGVTFNGGIADIEEIIVNNSAALASKATFTDTVDAVDITMGDGAGTGTNTVIFSTGGGAFAVASAITGDGVETNNVSVTGGDTLSQDGVWDALNTVAISGTDTVLLSNANLTAENITIATGSWLETTAGTVTADIASTGTGTVLLNGGSVIGNIDGGVLDVDASGAVTGDIGAATKLSSIDVATGTTLTVNNAETVRATGIALAGAGSTLALNAADTETLTVTGAITSTTAGGNGVITFAGGDADENYVFVNNIGTATNVLDSINAQANDVAADITFGGNVFANSILVDNADTLTFTGSNAIVSGAITAGASGNGAVIVADGAEVSFGGILGGTPIGSFDVASGGIANIVNNVTANSAGAAIDIDGELNINAVDNTVTVATVTAAAGDIDIDGEVNVTGDNSVTIDSNNDLFLDGDLNVNLTDGAFLTLDSNGDVVVIGGTSNTDIRTNAQIVINGNTSFGGAAVALDNRVNRLTVASSDLVDFDPTVDAVLLANGDTLTFNNDAVFEIASEINIGNLADGDRLFIIDSDADVNDNGGATDYATLVQNGDIVLVDTALVDLEFNAADSTAQDLYVDANFNSASEIIGDAYDGAAQALMDFDTAAGDLATARSNLLSASTAAEAKEVAETLSPTVDAGASTAAFSSSNAVLGLTGARLGGLRDGDGMSTGSGFTGANFWVQGFGQHADHSERDGVDGFDADTYGVAIGTDAEIIDGGARIGVALSYANSDVESKDAASTNSDIDSYQLTVYAGTDLTPEIYIDGMVSYAWNSIDTTRHDVGGIAGLDIDGDYNADQWGARVEVGRPFPMQGGLTLTPSVMANYGHYSADTYDEDGTNPLALQNVDSDDMNVFELGVGIDAEWDLRNNDGSALKPALHAAYRHDFVGDEVQASSNFLGGGASFETDGIEPAQSVFNVGGGLTWETTTNWDLSAEYDYEFKSDYDAHSGIVRAGYKF